MCYVTIIWSMVASACFMLAVIHLLIWCRNRAAWAGLFLSLTAGATAVLAMIELSAMKAQTPSGVATANRWGQVPVLIIIISLVVFVRVRLRAGRPWLGWTVCILRTACLLPAFLCQSLNYRQVTGLRHVTLLGESVSIPEGVPNPWMLLGQLSLVLCIVYVTDAIATARRRSDWRQALAIGGSIVFFVLTGGVQSVLSFWGIVHMPAVPSLFFVGMVAAIAYELSRDAGRAAQLADDLRQSDARMALAADATGVGVWQWSLADDHVWGSEKWLGLFGFAQNETVTFQKVIQRIHPDDRDKVEREARRALAERRDYRADFRVVLPDSSQRWIVVRGGTYLGANGEPARMMGTAIDLTDRKRTELALKESEHRFLQVAEAAGRFVWEVDAAGLYTYVSPSVEKILGYTPDDLVGKRHFYDLFIPSAREELKSASMRVFSKRVAFRDFPNANLSKGGKTVHLETSGSPVLDSAGNLAGYRGADTDVTERRTSEIENQRHRNELARVARVATMGQLASSLAHELNQPLGAILRNAEAAGLYLQDPSPDLDELRAILADIRKDDQRAGEVIDRMRAMMKRRELERCLLDLGGLVKTVGVLLRPDAERRRMRLALKTGEALPAVQGDHVQLQQVLINLMINAMDAMEETPPQDRVVTVEVKSAASEIEVTVSDNGSGICADKIARVFEPFYTSKPDGLGMGLAIAKDIVEAHGGRLRVESKAAGGAIFTFALPVADGGNA